MKAAKAPTRAAKGKARTKPEVRSKGDGRGNGRGPSGKAPTVRGAVLEPQAAARDAVGAALGDPTPDLVLTHEQLLELYRYLRMNRMVEDRLVKLYRQGQVVGGLYSSLGQEGSSIGTAYALDPKAGDIVSPLIRNLGALLVFGVRAREIFMQYMARGLSPTKGKDCNLHFGGVKRGIVSPISMLGSLIPVMAGMALAAKMQKKKLVTMTYIGDGGTSTGEFHEGLNFAAVMRVPFILVAENNQWAYSTPTIRQMANTRIVDRAIGYGIAGERVDGNDVLAVFQATRRARLRALRGEGVTLLEVMTMRMKGHAEHDDARYVPKIQFEEWKKKDPIERFERRLLEEGVAKREELDAVVAEINARLDEDVKFAEASPFPDPEEAARGVYAE
jgi:pyruvate dehydrogenase E1 component alpha subunit/2-oxoisovalerate dehydrogenase E1 component alpha subunit